MTVSLKIKFRSSHRRCSVKKGIIKCLQKRVRGFAEVKKYLVSTHLTFTLLLITQDLNKIKQENAMRCNNRDNLLQLSFSVKISMFPEAYI